jgi:hypothetical protein
MELTRLACHGAGGGEGLGYHGFRCGGDQPGPFRSELRLQRTARRSIGLRGHDLLRAPQPRESIPFHGIQLVQRRSPGTAHHSCDPSPPSLLVHPEFLALAQLVPILLATPIVERQPHCPSPQCRLEGLGGLVAFAGLFVELAPLSPPARHSLHANSRPLTLYGGFSLLHSLCSGVCLLLLVTAAQLLVGTFERLTLAP